MTNKKRIVAVLNDLMFTVKIQEAAKRAGLETVFVKSQQHTLDQAKQNPAVIILDLNCDEAAPLETIEKLKADDESRKVSLLGYVSHVQVGPEARRSGKRVRHRDGTFRFCAKPNANFKPLRSVTAPADLFDFPK